MPEQTNGQRHAGEVRTQAHENGEEANQKSGVNSLLVAHDQHKGIDGSKEDCSKKLGTLRYPQSWRQPVIEYHVAS